MSARALGLVLALTLASSRGAALAAGTPAGATDAPPVAGVAVPITGDARLVPADSLRQAGAVPLGPGLKAARLEVVGPREIHAYPDNPDLGWVRLRLVDVRQPDGREVPGWVPAGLAFWAQPEVLALVQAADTVEVFPVATPRAPHRGQPSRQLDAAARTALAPLLGTDGDWSRVVFDARRTGPEAGDVGLRFARGADELVLFFSSEGVVDATFDGERSTGLLEPQARRGLEDWKLRYARPELAAVAR